MRSIFGECTGNVRSTPTPKDCLRTVNVSRTPSPWRLITTPSKTWVRRRVPSMTWKWTLTRSPAAKRGTRRICARSRLSMTVLMAKKEPRARRGSADRDWMVAKRLRPPATLLQPPAPDVLMMAREQDLGHRPAAPLRGARVVRVLRRAFQRRAEGLLQRGVGVAERPRQLAQDGVADDHRSELAAREHVAADRDLVRAEVVDDPLVEALVAPAQQGHPRLGRELGGERVVQQPPARGQGDHPPPLAQVDGVDAVALAQRGLHDVDAQHHARPAAERRVVDSAPAQRRRRSRVDALEGAAERQRVGDMT